jgi:hypothetical protein
MRITAMSMFIGVPTLPMTGGITWKDVGTRIPALAPWRVERLALASGLRSGAS